MSDRRRDFLAQTGHSKGPGIDVAMLREALKAPGMDTRQWLSYGIVTPGTDVDGTPQDVVEFDDDLGPLVSVLLAPSDIPVVCRVASFSAGAGEGEYHPFVENDEVIVAIPEGSEIAGPVIFGRLNNGIDTFPTTCAGQETTENKIAFKRRRTPYVEETSGAIFLRTAGTGAFINISSSGNVTIRDGAKGALQMGPDVFGYTEGLGEVVAGDDTTTPSPQALLQMDLTGRRFTLQMDDAMIQVNGSKSDNSVGKMLLMSPGDITFQAGGASAGTPAEHVATTELVLGTIEAFAAALITAAGGAPLTPAHVGVALAAMGAAMGAAGGIPMGPVLTPFLLAGLQVGQLLPKPPVAPGAVQVAPTLGAIRVFTG